MTPKKTEKPSEHPAYPQLAFVTNIIPSQRGDPTTRTLIRQHVMRDIGRARRKGGRSYGKTTTIPLVLINDSKAHALQDCDHDGSEASEASLTKRGELPFPESSALYGIPRSPSPSLVNPFEHFPIEMDMRKHELHSLIFDDKNGCQRAFRENWYTAGLSDRAAFLHVLANSAEAVVHLRQDSTATKEALLLQNQAVQSVNTRIADPLEATSDGVIAAITAFTCHAYFKHYWENWHNHIHGLKRILQLRGGVETLEGNPPLRWTVLWVDVVGASEQDLRPTFEFPYGLPSLPENCGKHTSSKVAELRRNILPGSEIWVWLDTFAEFLARLAFDLEHNGEQTWMRSDYLYSDILPLLYRLLLIQKESMESAEMNNSQFEILRLGMLLALAEIRRNFGTHQVDSSVQVSKLQECLRSNHEPYPEGFEIVTKWALVMGLIECKELETRAWFFRRIEESSRLTKYNDLLDAARQVIWLDASHGQLLQRIFEDK